VALDIYQAVTDRIIELLDQGTVPWRQPITNTDGNGLPKNLLSNKHYRGINVFLLAVTAWAEGYESPYWLTFKQARERGGHVRKGEKGSLVIFWKQYATRDKQTGDPVVVPVLRHYTVFNAAQCDELGLPDGSGNTPEAPMFEPIRVADAIVECYERGPRIEHAGGRAYYRPSEDLVRIPDPARFVDAESYYSTLFHELAHSTGHSSRLDRGLGTKLATFGSPDYSKEELVAEMGAAFLAAAAGISPPTIEQSAAYIESWRKRLKADKKLVVQAAGAGQRAADWILGVKWDGTDGGDTPSVVEP
jgi:antirestriction protein ArdC